MKKFRTILIYLCIIITVFSSFTYVNAASTVSSYSKFLSIEPINSNGQEGVIVYFNKLPGYNDFTLSNPDRVVIDFVSTSYNGKSIKIDVQGNVINSIRYAQFEKNTVRVVLDINANSNDQSNINKNDYKIEKGEGYLKVYFDTGDNSDKDNNNQDSQSQDENKETESVPTNESNNEQKNEQQNNEQRSNEQASRSDYNYGVITLPAGITVSILPRGNVDEVSISLGNYKQYDITSLTQPDRIVVDIPNADFTSSNEKIEVDANYVQSLRYAQFKDNVGRIVFDLNGKSYYRVNETEGKIILSVEKPKYRYVTYKNMTYYRTGDRVYFSIPDSKLTEGGQDLKKYYTASYDSTGKVYTITFKSEYASSLSSGTMELNDDLFESVTIDKNTKTGNTSLIFKAREKLAYVIMTRPDAGDTAITVLKPASKSDRLVVIDPGHGGVEPGAIYGGVYEKDINLDIALRLNELLKKNNINTYMIREDDRFVGLYERAYIANTLNATLFLSIHNNAIGDLNYTGTMTFYNVKSTENLKGFNSYNFAVNIQKSLINKLGTKDRNVRSNNTYVVLKATKMTAVLAEVAFLSNAGERQKLQTEQFRQKAAEALCEAIIKSLNEINQNN